MAAEINRKKITVTVPVASQSIEQTLKQAIIHHQLGKLQQAEHLYLNILQIQSQHPDAHHNMGILSFQQKQFAAGLLHFKTALEAAPHQGQYWLSYIDALIQSGHENAARQVLEQGRQRGLQGNAIDALAQRLRFDPKSVAKPSTIEGKGGMPASLPTKPNKKNSLFNRKSLKAGKRSGKQSVTAARMGIEPDAKIMEKLQIAYTGRRYQEAELIALEITRCYPGNGFGWKALGVILHEQGRARAQESLAAKQRAVKLLPKDAEAHSNLGIGYRDLGYLKEAEASCRQALALRPEYAEALDNLGITLKDQGRLNEAEASYRRALEIKPESVNTHNNLGNALLEQKRLLEAEASYRRALELKPDYLDAHNNLGNTLLKQGRLHEAEASYRSALEIDPDYYIDAYYNLGNILCDLGDMEQAVAAYQKAWAIDPDVNGLKAAVWLAILYYLEDNVELCRKMLLAAKPIMTTTDDNQRAPRVYRLYLDRLLAWHQHANVKLPSTSGIRDILYVVGDSHSLSAHGIAVNYHGRNMRCSAQWIAGCKQWHLGNSNPNKYKHKFELVMQRLPPQSTILLQIGEIDCRSDEGIIKAWRKTPEISLDEVALNTAQSYVGYIVDITKSYGHSLIVGGIPATNIELKTLSADKQEQFVGLLRMFNAKLKTLALEAGMGFLDVYALTDRGDGVANGQWHIDGHHLLPSAIPEAFSKQLTTPK